MTRLLESPPTVFAHARLRHLLVGLAGGIALWAASPPARAQQAAPPLLHDVAALADAVGRFAGAPARVDPRLIVPRCPSPALSWARSDVVRADCTSPAWTLYIPVDGAGPAAQPLPAAARPRPAVRRGDRVMVEASGPGWAVAVEAEAERDADGGRVALRGPAGRRFTGLVGEGGRISLAR